MTLTFALLIGVALITLVLVFLRGGARVKAAKDESELSQLLQSVDLEAFRNLTDPAEEQYLRDYLRPAEFRKIERLRLRAAIDYLMAVSHNAALLLQFGQAARRSPDERIAEAGRTLLDNALRLRFFSLLALGKLYVRIVIPGAVLQPAGIVDRYEQMTDKATQLGRLQYPSRGALLSKSL